MATQIDFLTRSDIIKTVRKYNIYYTKVYSERYRMNFWNVNGNKIDLNLIKEKIEEVIKPFYRLHHCIINQSRFHSLSIIIRRI